jgi:plasmid replication initiation protein
MYELGNVGGLKSVYGIRLYELLVQYKAIGERTIKIKYLREILCLGAKYKAMKDFKKYIIESAMKEINEQTDLRISYENIKRGRSIISLHFTIKARRRTEIAPNNPKKYLSAEAINTEFPTEPVCFKIEALY